jgi:hypothetical protein
MWARRFVWWRGTYRDLGSMVYNVKVVHAATLRT